jgi:hypothetical protein
MTRLEMYALEMGVCSLASIFTAQRMSLWRIDDSEAETYLVTFHHSELLPTTNANADVGITGLSTSKHYLEMQEYPCMSL